MQLSRSAFKELTSCAHRTNPGSTKLLEGLLTNLESIRMDGTQARLTFERRSVLRTQDQEIAYGYGSKGPMPTRGIKRQNDDDFDALSKCIVDLQKALKKTSGPALYLLFSGEDDVHSNAIPLIEKQQKFERRTRAFVSTLKYLRARCNYLLAEGFRRARRAISGNAAWRMRLAGSCECAEGNLQAVQWTVCTA